MAYYIAVLTFDISTRGSAIAKGPRVSGTLHWRLSINYIICSWTI